MLRRTLLRAEDRVPGLLGFWLFLSEGQRWGFGRWPRSMQQERGDLKVWEMWHQEAERSQVASSTCRS